jgi:two-component system, LytTR family, sensor kinase
MQTVSRMPLMTAMSILMLGSAYWFAQLLLPPPDALLRALSVCGSMVLLHAINLYVFNRLFSANHIRAYFFVALFLGIVFTALRYLMECFLLPRSTQLVPITGHYPNPFVAIVSSAIMLLISTVVLFVTRAKAIERERLKLEYAGQQAKLIFLYQQINPHFLFNALHNVYALMMTKSEKAPEMLLSLTEMLRYSIYQQPNEKVPVEAEAEQIEGLLNIAGFSCDNPSKLQFVKNLNGGMIAPMILFPLVENCIKHGDFRHQLDASLRIVLYTDEHGLRLQTWNSFDASIPVESGGLGLANIRERLALLYPKQHHITTQVTRNIFHLELLIEWNT